MLKRTFAGLTALTVLGSAILVTTPASAQRWHRGHHHGGGAAAAVIGGLAAGAIIGGALAPRPYYAPYPAYRYSEPAYADGDEVAYCSQRFRSYDPASGTYLGYDGLRHPCP